MSCIISYVFSGHTGIYVSQRIGRSKSKVITVEENTSLLSFRNKHKRDA
jgi:hypothetical protein